MAPTMTMQKIAELLIEKPAPFYHVIVKPARRRCTRKAISLMSIRVINSRHEYGGFYDISIPSFEPWQRVAIVCDSYHSKTK